MADTKRGRERKGANKAWQRTRRLIDAELDAGDESPPVEDDADEDFPTAIADAPGRDGPRLVDFVEFDEDALAAPDIGERTDGDD